MSRVVVADTHAHVEGRLHASKLAVLALGSVLAIGGLGCSHNPDRLPDLQRRFYNNLDSPDDQKQFLKTRKKHRQAFLEERGLYQRWLALPDAERKAVQQNEVQPGFQEFSVFMAFGPPADTQVRTTEHRKVEFHTFIRCTSGPKIGRYVPSNLDCDGTASETQVAVENGIVSEIKYPD